MNKTVNNAELVIKKITSSLKHIVNIPIELNQYTDNETIAKNQIKPASILRTCIGIDFSPITKVSAKGIVANVN